MKALFASAVGAFASSWYNFSSVNCAASKSPFSHVDFRQYTLMNFYDESHDTRVFRFALPEADMSLNLEVLSFVELRHVGKDGSVLVRPFAPINSSNQRGYFEILVKNYQNSKVGNYLFSLKKGDAAEFKGPFVRVPIKSNRYKKIGILASDTGIAPVYQVARNVLRAPNNKTEISLIYENTRKEDVLLGNELNELMQTYPLFSPYFVLSKAPSDWMGGVGHITKEMVKALMPAPNRVGDSIILVSGPPPFLDSISGNKENGTSPAEQGDLKGVLSELGYIQKMVFKI
ncbi:NADH-cytochrome b5 reductase, putative [Trypanosoma brucei brucei TREU927]|uniref:NADH-cytochrome b5 reductase, putative n=1 Tax=Trypanosoma brucei brucei (strain 927/4 GUTat10.1) TaxID=185431 RepID=Q57Y81_TRYB2|nr:NADH-cytochrome b5 reductase, putative [Trypanosoma brucei brucei TREU927]AAX69410.1 NADH-cytochrome b5 reductase, putative [Trypanosoma brucei]AAZ12335.1 NADH-cytochrome b5 reductase, putative [Trypanosoma brucei brucei TREU927]